MDKAFAVPALSNACDDADQGTHRHAVDRHPNAGQVKVIGTDLTEIDGLAKTGRASARPCPERLPRTRSAGSGGYYLEITADRDALARYGIMVQDVQDVIATALGGQTVTTTVEGRQRFTVNMRSARTCATIPQAIAERCAGADAEPAVLFRSLKSRRSRRRAGRHRSGPKTGQLATYVYVDIRDRDLAGTSPMRSAPCRRSIQFPPGYYVIERTVRYLERAAARLKVVIPIDSDDYLPVVVPELPARSPIR